MNYVDPEYYEGVLASIRERAWRQINSCGMVRELPLGYNGEMAAMEAAIRPPLTPLPKVKWRPSDKIEPGMITFVADPSAPPKDVIVPPQIDWERMAAAHAHEADLRARALEMAQAKMARLTGELVVAKQVVSLLSENVARLEARLAPAPPARSTSDIIGSCMKADRPLDSYGR